MVGDRVVIEFTDGTDPLDITTSETCDVSTESTVGVTLYQEYSKIQYPWHRIQTVSRWQMYDDNGAPLRRTP